MDEGRIAGTDEILDATEIRHRNQIDGIDWRCPGCDARVYAAAWDDPNKYKVTAHFKRYPAQPTDPNCLYEQVAKAGPCSLTCGEMGRPRQWIDRIDFPPPVAPSERVRECRTTHDRQVHSATRRSLTGACRFHHAIKGNRRSWPLQVSGVPGSNYFDVFEPFFQIPTEPASRIWFGDLFLTERPVETETTIGVAVAGHITVVAETTNWSDFQKEVLLSRVRRAQESKAAWSAPKPQVYVLAERGPQCPNIVHFSDPRKFALISPQ